MKKYKYPLWFKIMIYGLYCIIVFTVIFWFATIAEKRFWEQELDKYRPPEGIIKRMHYKASWYDYKLVGHLGVVCYKQIEECYTETHRVAASRDYPRGTLVGVCLIDNSKCVEVLITDYIEHPDRDIDLSSYAFSQLGNLQLGILDVSIRKLDAKR